MADTRPEGCAKAEVSIAAWPEGAAEAEVMIAAAGASADGTAGGAEGESADTVAEAPAGVSADAATRAAGAAAIEDESVGGSSSGSSSRVHSVS